MSDAPAILLIDSNEGDRALSTLLLQRALPGSTVNAISNALGLVDALLGQPPDVVVISCDGAWAGTLELVGLIKRRVSAAAIVLFGHDTELTRQVFVPGLACDGVVRKSSAGFLALADVVVEALSRRSVRRIDTGTPAMQPAPAAADPPAGEIEAPHVDEELPATAEVAADTVEGVLAAPEVLEEPATAETTEAAVAGAEAPPVVAEAVPDVTPEAGPEVVPEAAVAAYEPLFDAVSETVSDTVPVAVEEPAPEPPFPAETAPPATNAPAPVAPVAVAPAPAPAAEEALERDQEMREIALVFSHDLREPVQQIERLARRGRTNDESLGAASALQHVLRSSERVNRMLDDMVEYFSVTNRRTTHAPVDLNACLKVALGNIRTIIEETYAQVHAEQLPMSVGDHVQLVHVFQNLISNAVKFRGFKAPVVSVTCEPHDGQWLIQFRDNGIGIPPEFTERIFELGRRLHTREDYPGSGIGLAMCRRIVERHGGRIWAESQAGEGSTFLVLLPQADVDIVRSHEPAPAERVS